jgi:hypothetical protein
VSRARRDAELNLLRTSVDLARSLGREPDLPGTREELDATADAQLELSGAAGVLRMALDRGDDEGAARVAKAIMELDPERLSDSGRRYQAKVAELFAKTEEVLALDAAISARKGKRWGAVVINGRVRGQAIRELG